MPEPASFKQRVLGDRHAEDVAADFRSGRPSEIFARLTVYVEFDGDTPARRLVIGSIPGEAGRWVLTYSSLQRLQRARRENDLEYSAMHGHALLGLLPPDAGLWFDPSFPGGCQIILPVPVLPYEVGQS